LAAGVDRLERAGARIDHERRPDIDAGVAALDGLRLIAAATDISDTEQEHAEDVEAGRALTHRSWDVLQRHRGAIRQRWAEFFGDVDILLCPVLPVPPFRHVQSGEGSNWIFSKLADHDDRPYGDLIGWNALIGSAYLPVTVPPFGRTTSGLPIGIQVVAPYLHDRTSLAFARCVADVIGGYEPPPLATGTRRAGR
jgi:amidase